MSKYSHTSVGDTFFKIAQETFPIIGNADPALRRRIDEERRVSAFDLWQVKQMTAIYYNHPFDSEIDKWGRHPEEVHVSYVLVKREKNDVVFEAVAEVTVQEKPGDEMSRYVPHPKQPEVVVARATVSVRKILSIIKDYAKFHLNDGGIISEFTKAGALEKVEGLDRERKLLHFEILSCIQDALEGQLICIIKDDESKDRFLTTALMMHLIPARVFEEVVFVGDNIGAKYKNLYRYYSQSLKDTEDNPFKRGPG